MLVLVFVLVLVLVIVVVVVALAARCARFAALAVLSVLSVLSMVLLSWCRLLLFFEGLGCRHGAPAGMNDSSSVAMRGQPGSHAARWLQLRSCCRSRRACDAVLHTPMLPLNVQLADQRLRQGCAGQSKQELRAQHDAGGTL